MKLFDILNEKSIFLPHSKIIEIYLKDEDLCRKIRRNLKGSYAFNEVLRISGAQYMYQYCSLEHKENKNSVVFSKSFLKTVLNTHVPARQKEFRILAEHNFVTHKKFVAGQWNKKNVYNIKKFKAAVVDIKTAAKILLDVFLTKNIVNYRKLYSEYSKSTSARDVRRAKAVALLSKKDLNCEITSNRFVEVIKHENLKKVLKSELKSAKRILDKALIRKLLKYTFGNICIFPRNIKETNRDYHLLTILSKETRHNLFIKEMGYVEVDMINSGYSIFASLFPEAKYCHVYLRDRKDILAKAERFNSQFAKNVKKTFLAVMYGMNVPYQWYNNKFFDQLFDKVDLSLLFNNQEFWEFYEYIVDLIWNIYNETKKIRKELWLKKDYIINKYKLQNITKKNILALFIQSVESEIMENFKYFVKSKGYQVFRIHDALFIKGALKDAQKLTIDFESLETKIYKYISYKIEI